jgi:isochorismate pyruvate lyase
MREEYLDGTEVSGGYCRALKQGNMIFVSGTGGLDQNGKLAGPDVTSQSRLVYKKIEKALAHFGADLSHVVSVVIYVIDMSTTGEYQAVHSEVFAKYKPTSTLVGVSGLVAGMSIEIKVEAMID